MGGLIQGQEPTLREEDIRVEEQVVKVAAIEDDGGVVTTSYSSISNTLYDLADANSKTNRVVLPQGTTISLAATSKAGVGSYRASYEVAAKDGRPQTVIGTSAATDLAYKLDLLSLPAKDKAKILRLSEAEQVAEARKHLPRLEEKNVKVSGYVTKSGRHVGSYSQLRKLIGNLGHHQTMEMPDGVTVKRTLRPKGYVGGNAETITIGHRDERGAKVAHTPETAAEDAIEKSLATSHEGAIGGKKTYSSMHEYETKTGDKLDRRKVGDGKGDDLSNFDAGTAKRDLPPEKAAKVKAGSKQLGDDIEAFKKREAENPIVKGTDPVSKLKAGKVTRVGNYMIRENGQRAGVYSVTADDGIGATVHADSPEAAVRLAGRAQENPAEWAKAVKSQQKAEGAAPPKTGGGRRVIPTETKGGFVQATNKPTPKGSTVKDREDRKAVTVSALKTMKRGDTHKMEGGVTVKAEGSSIGSKDAGTVFAVRGGGKHDTFHSEPEKAAQSAHERGGGGYKHTPLASDASNMSDDTKVKHFETMHGRPPTAAERKKAGMPVEGKGGAAETIDKEKRKRKAQESALESVPSEGGFIRG